MKNDRGYATQRNKIYKNSPHSIDKEIEQLTLAIEEVTLRKKASERRIRKEEEALKDQDLLLGHYHSRLRRIFREQQQDHKKCQAVISGGKSEHCERKTTHYSIPGFDTTEKRELFVGYRVFTNDGTGRYKGLREATVISPLPKNKVKLQFDEVSEPTVRLVSNLQHTEPRDK